MKVARLCSCDKSFHVFLFIFSIFTTIFWHGIILRTNDALSKTNEDQLLADAPNQLDSVLNHRIEDKPLLLSVPFYVYEELAWMNATISNKLDYRVSIENLSTSLGAKHSNDFWFASASLRHPMRTMDPSTAKLFVVPLLMNAFDDKAVYRRNLCFNSICNKQLLSFAGEVLHKSPWFQNSSHLHIVTTSHFVNGKQWWESQKPKTLTEALYRCHAISHEDSANNAPDRLNFPSYLVGKACPLQREEKHQVAMIASLNASHEPNQVFFKDRRNICKWISQLENVTFSICGSGDQCPALAGSQFGFHARGDTFGSSRLMDTLLSGTVPIFTRRQQYNALPRWINWSLISNFVSVESGKNQFSTELNKILTDKKSYRERHAAVLENRLLFDWTTLYPFDTYMYMLQASLYPDSRHPTSSWSALIMPKLITSNT